MTLLEDLIEGGIDDPDTLDYAAQYDAYTTQVPAWKDMTAEYINGLVALLNQQPAFADFYVTEILLWGLKAIALGARDAESIAVAAMSIVCDPAQGHTVADLLSDDDE